MWGETQEELSMAIGVQLTAICNYESGERIPERDILVRIAKHYRVTVNDLLNENYSNLPKLQIKQPNDIAAKLLFFDRVLPFASSEEALININFKEAFDLHQMLFRKIICGDSGISHNDIEKCLELYDKAIEDNVIEARANRLWWIVLFGFVINVLTVELVDLMERVDLSNIDIKKLLKSLLPSFDEIETEEQKEIKEIQLDFYNNTIVDLLVNIRCLKLSNKYSDLGDYYLAISYLIGISPNTVSPEMKSSMGMELLMLFDTMGNPYVKHMLGFTE